MSESEVKRKNKKRKYLVESVEPISVKKMLAHPTLVTFRTKPPTLESGMVAELEREPYVEGTQKNYKYTSQFSFTNPDGLVYQGSNKISQLKSHDICLIGLANKSTGTIKLIEAEEFSVIPKIASLAPSISENASGGNATLMFGTKKSKLKLQALLEERERRDTENLGAVERALPFMEQSQLNTEAAPEDNSYFLPPVNEQARTLDEVYQLSNIVEDHILEHLIDEASTLLETQGIDTKQVTPLFLTCLAGARLEREEDNRLRYACAAIYVEYLCRIVSRLDLPRQSMESDVLQHLTNTYKITKSTRFMSPEMRDKALAHLVIISIIINKFQVPLDTVANSVAVNRIKLTSMITLLRLKKKGSNITLQLPLPAPSTRDVQRVSVLKKRKK